MTKNNKTQKELTNKQKDGDSVWERFLKGPCETNGGWGNVDIIRTQNKESKSIIV